MKIVKIITISITLLASIVSSQKACNGYAELCDKSYSNVAYATTHNSYAFEKNIAANQNYDIPTQLDDGIRGFMLDALYPQNNTNEVHLCHGSCDILDDGKAIDTLSQIVTWLGKNPNEVITILWENTGKVPVTAATFDQIYTQTGLSKFVHFQESADAEWPTLGKMIDSGKKVVNFIGSGAEPKTVPWLMPEFDYVFETPFQNTDINSFQCLVDRPKNQPRPMYVLNHFVYTNLGPPFQDVDIPQPDKANATNSASLVTHSQQCKQTFNKIPNFIAVDFYDQGGSQNVFSVTADLNGVQYTPKQLGDGKAPSNVQGPKTEKTNTAQLNNDLRNANILVGLAGVGTLAMFVL